MNIFETLNELSATTHLLYLVIGGHAVHAHGYSRVTQDLDSFVRDYGSTEIYERIVSFQS